MKPCLLRWSPAAVLLLAGSTTSLAAGLFGASLDLSTLNGTNGFVCHGINVERKSSISVSAASDLNGDGIDDLIIGAMTPKGPGQWGIGESYIVFGGVGVGSGGNIELSSLNGVNGFVCGGIDPRDASGFSVSGAGDINSDGFGDLIIGAFGADPNGAGAAGESYIVFGSKGVGSSGSIELSSLDGVDGFTCNGIDPLDVSGSSVSDAGDVNGDGFDDFIIGAYGAISQGATSSGESYVVFGGAGVGANGAIELSSLDGTNGFVCTGIMVNDQSGYSVSAAGDVNGDGFDDVLIGARGSGPNGIDESGRSYVIFGSATIGSGGCIELASINGTNGFACNGINEGDYSGSSVSGAGDVNGDGFDDVAIGAWQASPDGASSSGECYVVFGGTAVGAGGSIELSSLNGANGFVCSGINAADYSGFSVSGAGDTNGDGTDDLIIGAPGANGQRGDIYVLFGGNTVGDGGSIDLSSLDGASGFTCSGINLGDFSGISVSSAGDVNGDGTDDLIIGSIASDLTGQDLAGESYVIFGRTPCPADLNADGVVDTADLGILISQFNTPGPGADINGDGIIDTADLGVLIGAFGTTTCD